jgi:hypothetical protein
MAHINLKDCYYHKSKLETIKNAIQECKKFLQYEYYCDKVIQNFLIKVYKLPCNLEYYTLQHFATKELEKLIEDKKIQYEFLNFLVYDKIDTNVKLIERNYVPYLFLSLILLNSDIIIQTSVPFDIIIWCDYDDTNNTRIAIEDIIDENIEHNRYTNRYFYGLTKKIDQLYLELCKSIDECVMDNIEKCQHIFDKEKLYTSYITVIKSTKIETDNDNPFVEDIYDDEEGRESVYHRTCIKCGINQERIENRYMKTEWEYFKKDIEDLKDEFIKERNISLLMER